MRPRPQPPKRIRPKAKRPSACNQLTAGPPKIAGTNGWHAGAYLGTQLALNPGWAPFLQFGLIYEHMDGRPRRDGLRFSIEIGLTFFL